MRSRGLGIFCKDILNTLYKNKCICSLYIKYIIAVGGTHVSFKDIGTDGGDCVFSIVSLDNVLLRLRLN